ncbi:MAG: DUF1858 domain-containing protein [Breznakibacter sp.]
MLPITPKTKIGELLDTYPQLEDLLLELSPSFIKLKNPVLRKTVAKIATLQQAAAIGNLKVNDLVGKLRQAVGQDDATWAEKDEGLLLNVVPHWTTTDFLVDTYDATPVIESGGSPMADIINLAKQLDGAQYFIFTSPFLPAPLIDMLRGLGCEVISIRHPNSNITNYVRRTP